MGKHVREIVGNPYLITIERPGEDPLVYSGDWISINTLTDDLIWQLSNAREKGHDDEWVAMRLG